MFAGRGFISKPNRPQRRKVNKYLQLNAEIDSNSKYGTIKPLIPTKLLTPKLRRSKMAPCSLLLPASRGSIAVRTTRGSVSQSSSHSSQTEAGLGVKDGAKVEMKTLQLGENSLSNSPYTFQEITSSIDSEEELLTPQSVFCDSLEHSVIDPRNSADLKDIKEHLWIRRQNEQIDRMLQYGYVNTVVARFQTVNRQTLQNENKCIEKSVQKIYGSRRLVSSIQDRIEGRTLVVDGKFEIYESERKALSAREGLSRDQNYYKKEVNRMDIILRGQESGAFSNTNASKIKAYFTRAYAHAQLGHLKEALVDFSRCLALDHMLPAVFYNRAQIFRRLECHAFAVKDLDGALKIEKSEKNRALYTKAKAFVKRELGMFLEAGQDLKKCLTTRQYIDLVKKMEPNREVINTRDEAEDFKKCIATRQYIDLVKKMEPNREVINTRDEAEKGIKEALASVVAPKSIFHLSNKIKLKKGNDGSTSAALMGVLKARKKFKRALSSPYAHAFLLAGKPGRRDEATLVQLTRTVENLNLFDGISFSIINLFCQFAELKSYPSGSYIYKHGEKCNGMYVVVSGILRTMKRLDDNRRNEVEVIARRSKPGDWFGEVLPGSIRNSAEYVQTSCELLYLQYTGNSDNHGDAIAIEVYHALMKKRVDVLNTGYVFNSMPEEMKVKLAAAGNFQKYPVESTLIEEGQTVDSFYVIVRGTCKVLRTIDNQRCNHSNVDLMWKNQFRNVLVKQRELAKPGVAALKKRRDNESRYVYKNVQVSSLGPGDVFGELAVLSNRTHVPSPVTIKSDTGLVVYIFTANDIREFVNGGYFRGTTGERLRNYMCIKVPSEHTVKHVVDQVTKWNKKKCKLVTNSVLRKNTSQKKSRIMKLSALSEVNEIQELKTLKKADST
jgi:CRP-like cAMP-binding protein